MNLDFELKKFGLNSSEISVYLFLLQNGLSTPPNVSRGTNIARTNCYNILSSLQHHGLIAEHKTGKRQAYMALDPSALIVILESKKAALDRLVPELRSLTSINKNQIMSKYLSGLRETQELMDQTLHAKTKIAILELGEPNKFKSTDLLQDYITRLDAAKVAYSRKLVEADTTFEKLDFVFMIIWDNSVAFYYQTNPISATVLENTSFCALLKLMFQTMPAANNH